MNTHFRWQVPKWLFYRQARFSGGLGSGLVVLFLAACGAGTAVSDPGMSPSEEPFAGKFVRHDLMTDDPAAAKKFYGGMFGWIFEQASNIGDGYTLIRHEGRSVGGLVRLAGTDDSRAPSQGMLVWNELLAADTAGALKFFRELAVSVVHVPG